MNADQAKALRAPFAPSEIGKLPRLWCGKCRESRTKACEQHPAAKCKECGNKHSTAALHLDYVGHAETTDRLLDVDPDWNWEPLALGPDGLPVFDRNGGLWIRMTVAGVTRLGYGNAEGKTGGDAVKEILGDAIRNSAMRYGVALDLWRKTDRAEQAAQHEPEPVAAAAKPRPTAVAAPEPVVAPPVSPPAAAPRTDERLMTDAQLRNVQRLFTKQRFRTSQERHDYVLKAIGVEVENSRQLTVSQAARLIDALEALPSPPSLGGDDPWTEVPQ